MQIPKQIILSEINSIPIVFLLYNSFVNVQLIASYLRVPSSPPAPELTEYPVFNEN